MADMQTGALKPEYRDKTSVLPTKIARTKPGVSTHRKSSIPFKAHAARLFHLEAFVCAERAATDHNAATAVVRTYTDSGLATHRDHPLINCKRNSPQR